MRRSLWTIVMAAGLLGVSAPEAWANEIKDCNASGKQNLSAAADFISKNMSAITDQYTFLSEKQRQEIVRKWPGLALKCNDDAAMCRNGSTTLGFAHGGPGNAINICHANMVDRRKNLCDIVEVIMHESGHAHGFRAVPGHNDPTDYIFQNDPIYRMGLIAESYCLTTLGATGSATIAGTPRPGLGGACKKDVDCGSGKCEKDKCVCNDDGDCPTQQRCYKPATQGNYCSSEHLALGASCKKNSQCASDRCQGDRCVCKDDSDCQGQQKCFTPVSKPNYCENTDLGLGMNCEKDSQCASGKCEDKNCVCAKDSDCGQNEKCFTPITKPNYCESTVKALGASCDKDSECASDKCEDKKCVCKKDSDCPGTKKCKTPITKKNYCE